MTTEAIDRGMTLIRNAVVSDLERINDVLVQWGLSPHQPNVPRLMWQPVNPGTVKNYIGMPSSWFGELALRAQASTLDDAQALLDTATANMTLALSIDDPDYTPGWSLKLRAIRPIIGVNGPPRATVGVVYRAELRPKGAA
jgi:hypothetical protein